ncbi:class I glutamine amidotransferase-like protein [Meredithblackwellia eburnea MCA 4105]
MPKILFILTSHSKLLNDHPTGWYLPECAHPYYILKKAGYEIEFASPKGGKAPLDPASVDAFKEDKECVEFLNNKETQELVNTTLKLSDVGDSEYAAIFYVGGHGPCFDLATDKTSIALIEKVFASGRPVSAVCHGPVVFHQVRTADGKSIFSGRKVTCFSNEEEEQVNMTRAIPFLVESDIRAKGGIFINERKPWGVEVVTDRTGGILITGANPASAGATAEAILEALKTG